MTRVWDKVARLMNLTGFRLEVETATFAEPKDPKNESLADNLLDLAVYAIIWMLHRSGQWGH